MNRDDVIEMARRAGLHIATDVNWMPVVGLEYAEKFIKLITQREREACAGLRKEVELQGKHPIDYEEGFWDGLEKYENLIRARGTT
jgi:hypothetical protein